MRRRRRGRWTPRRGRRTEMRHEPHEPTRFGRDSPVLRHWLANSTGFRVKGRHTSGIVERVFGPPGAPTTVAVRRRFRRRVVVAADAFDEVVPEEQAARLIEAGSQPLDVRQDSEWRRSRIPGAVHLELGDIIAGKRPTGDSFVTYCGHGQRSATAASLLARDGIHVAGMAGGIAAWERAGLPIER